MDILYISGYVRSGSTLLDLMLGSLPGFFSVGEISAMLHGLNFSRQDLCTCGEAFHLCDFWGEVWRKAHPERAWAARPDYESGFRDNATTARLPSLAFHCGKDPIPEKLQRYSRQLERMYGAVAGVAGCDVIVDSSKTPSHGLVLSTIPGIELHVVHLIRDARAVVFSQRRVKAKPDVSGKKATLPRRNTVMSSLRWLKANITAEFLKESATSFTQIRYEDLVREPNRVLTEILSNVGRKSVGEGFDFTSVVVGERHNVAGNPMRLAGKPIVIKADEEWKDSLGLIPHCVATCLCYPALHRYGYLT